jgi:hypothetical protein
MKTISIILLLACLSLVGCVTQQKITTDASGHSVTNFVKVADADRISKIAGNAAQVGSLAYLKAKPGDRGYFLVANENLKDLINNSNYDSGALSAALSSLPIKELKGDQGVIVVMTAQMIVEDALDSAKDVVSKRELVAAVLVKVQQGIQRALDATAPRSELNMPRAYVWRGPEPVQIRTTLEYETTENYLLWQNGKLVKH